MGPSLRTTELIVDGYLHIGVAVESLGMFLCVLGYGKHAPFAAVHSLLCKMYRKGGVQKN
eukprot:scaffold309238_cov18-Tisochrysis_lutea.AAC.1